MGGLGVGNDATCNTDNNTEGVIYAVSASVTAADYAEYFYSSEEMKSGDIVGLNLETGLVRMYQPGDKLLGVISTAPGITGNRAIENEAAVLVALMGQVPFSSDQAFVENGVVKTLDGQVIGHLLATGDVYVSISSKDGSQDLEIASLKAQNVALKDRLKVKPEP